ATMPNTFTALAGQDNASVAALFQQDFVMKGVKVDAQVLATALSVYATNATLDPTKVAATYGFTVSGDGAGTATANVGSNGDVFGVSNNSTLTLMDLLLAADAQAVDGILYNGNATKRNEANAVFSAVNQTGGINRPAPHNGNFFAARPGANRKRIVGIGGGQPTHQAPRCVFGSQLGKSTRRPCARRSGSPKQVCVEAFDAEDTSTCARKPK